MSPVALTIPAISLHFSSSIYFTKVQVPPGFFLSFVSSPPAQLPSTISSTPHVYIHYFYTSDTEVSF